MKIRCPNDGHIWDTKSTLKMITCPSCYRKINREENEYKEEFPGLEHFNLDENGVRILDPSLATPNSPKGRIIDVYFKPKKILCEYDESSDCRHVKYALGLPVVQEILKKKGWKT